MDSYTVLPPGGLTHSQEDGRIRGETGDGIHSYDVRDGHAHTEDPDDECGDEGGPSRCGREPELTGDTPYLHGNTG